MLSLLTASPALTPDLNLDELLEKALNQQDLTPEEGLRLLTAPAQMWPKIQQAADQLRRQLVGETVTYVINRNINFTNICEQHCSFCAFRRSAESPGAFWLDSQTILAKVQLAVEQNATEICMQGGLNPEAKVQGSSLGFYVQLVTTIKQTFP
ncbi:MAG: 7,8-didemethyl-8-hydroxy-5-deazariboflavin synthase subunit CofH, partial [Microcystaceae cyanobacterium]